MRKSEEPTDTLCPAVWCAVKPGGSSRKEGEAMTNKPKRKAYIPKSFLYPAELAEAVDKARGEQSF